MPVYELFCIAAHNPVSPTNLRQLVEGLSRQIHTDGGVVRNIQNLGIGLALPKRARRHQQWHSRGDHFTLLFDSSPLMVRQMNDQLGRDPLVVKWTVLKKGNSLATLLPDPAPSIDFDEAPRAL